MCMVSTFTLFRNQQFATSIHNICYRLGVKHIRITVYPWSIVDELVGIISLFKIS